MGKAVYEVLRSWKKAPWIAHLEKWTVLPLTSKISRLVLVIRKDKVEWARTVKSVEQAHTIFYRVMREANK